MSITISCIRFNSFIRVNHLNNANVLQDFLSTRNWTQICLYYSTRCWWSCTLDLGRSKSTIRFPPPWCLEARAFWNNSDYFFGKSDRVSSKPFAKLLVLFFQLSFPLQPQFIVSLPVRNLATLVTKIGEAFISKPHPSNLFPFSLMFPASRQWFGYINGNSGSQIFTTSTIILQICNLNNKSNECVKLFFETLWIWTQKVALENSKKGIDSISMACWKTTMFLSYVHGSYSKTHSRSRTYLNLNNRILSPISLIFNSPISIHKHLNVLLVPLIWSHV